MRLQASQKKTNLCLSYESKTGEERDLVILNPLPPSDTVRKYKKIDDLFKKTSPLSKSEILQF